MSIKITDKIIGRFREYLMDEEKAPATIDKYIRDIRAFTVWLSDSELNKKKVVEYKTCLTDYYAPASVNSMLSSINNFFEYNGWYQLKLKSLKIQRQIFAGKNKELTKQEYKRLLKTAEKQNNQKLNLIMQTICSCGLRVSELSYITIDALRRKRAIIKNKGKLRQVLLPDKLCRALLGYAKARHITEGTIFITKGGKPVDRSNIWKMMKKLCEDAGVMKEKVFPHNLRHLFAREHYGIEKDIVRLADILGHSSINTTRIYTMESIEKNRDRLQKLGLLLC